ncbi:MAG: TonB-dependent receptor [Gammaproteobacteria bacterium]|nr:TonB-dependent receptor [Gammaproteobacteria bacterium]
MQPDQLPMGSRALVCAAAFLLALPATQVALAEEDDDSIIEEVVVTGIRGSIRQSIDMKRDADNIVDALVAEDIGKFPDQNLAESLQRVSGVAIDRVRGEGSQVSIRGLGPQFVRVQVNGRSALSGAGGSFAGAIGGLTSDRSFRFEGMQAELVQAVEVYKSAQANLLEGGMAGTINIRTRRPFDNGGQRILAGNAYVTDDDLADDNGYRVAGVWSDTFAENTFGVLVSVAADDRTTREDWFNIPDYEPKTFNNAVDENGNPLPLPCTLPGRNPNRGCGYTGGNVRMGIVIEEKQRLNVSSALQWRPNEQIDLTFDLLHSELQREYTDYQNPLRTQAGLAGRATEVHLNENDITTYFATTGSRPRPFPRDFDTESEQQQFAANLTFTPSERLEFSFDLSHATGDVDELQTTTYYDIAGGVPATYSIENGYIPEISVDADLSDPSLYTFSYFYDQTNLSTDEETQGRADGTYRFDDGTAFHAGVSYRQKERTYMRRAIAIGTRFGDFIGEPLSAVKWHPLPVDDAFSGIDGSDSWPKQWLSADPDSVRQTYLVDRRDEIPAQRFIDADSAHSEDFNIEEDTLGAYFMVEMAGNLGDIPWSGNAGARWVRVERDSSGNVQPIDNVVFSEAAGVFVFLLLPSELQTHTNRFAEVLPALNLKFELREDLVGRFAWGKVMSQPSFSNLNPGGFKLASTRRVNEGNPYLEPYVAEQLDIGLEWYPTDDAIVALNAFGKEVNSFIITVTELIEFIDPNTNAPVPDPESGGSVLLQYQGPRNEEGAFIGGIEVAAQYAFTQLPSPFDGLGVQFNHTWVDTDAEFVNPNSGAAFDVPGLSEHTTNAVIFYEKYKFSGRIAWNRRDGFLLRVSSTRSNPEFTSPYWQLDAGFGYQVTDKISVVFEGINLTNENVDRYNIVGPVSQLKQLYFISNSGRRMQAGIRVRL